MTTHLHPETDLGLKFVMAGLRYMSGLVSDLRKDALDYFPKPIQAERILANIQDYLAEAMVLLEVPPAEGFDLNGLKRLTDAIGEAVDDVNKIHDINHQIDIEVMFGPGPKPFFKVEALATAVEAHNALLNSVLHAYRGKNGASQEEQDSARKHHEDLKKGSGGKGPRMIIGGLDDAPPEVLRMLFEQLRNRLED